MVTRRGALARWRVHLEEVIGVDEAAEVLDPLELVEWDQLATRAEFEELRRDFEELRREFDGLRGEFDELRREVRTDLKELRRDLLRVTGAQFFALIAAVAALAGLA